MNRNRLKPPCRRQDRPGRCSMAISSSSPVARPTWSEGVTSEIGREFEPTESTNSWGQLYSLSGRAPQVDALALLRLARHDQRFYWAKPAAGPDTGERLAAIGVAAELATPPLLNPSAANGPDRFALIRQQATQLFTGSVHLVLDADSSPRSIMASEGHPARPRLFGGFAFSPEFVPDNTWSVFHPAHFVLPHFQLYEVGEERWLTVNTLLPESESRTGVLAGMKDALAALYQALEGAMLSTHYPGDNPQSPPNQPPETRYPMSTDQWQTMVRQATDAIQAGNLQKVVLSRVAEIRRSHPPDLEKVIVDFRSDYANCFHFLFEPARERFFLGATPELLVELRERSFQTMALAGSAPRGRNEVDDQLFAQQLLNSAKNCHEHQLVVDSVRNRLTHISSDLHIPTEPAIFRLHNIQHLLTPISGRVNTDAETDVLTLVELLHPTPAMGGVPASEALRFLAESEPVPRGWYAAPVGWLDANLDGAFAVAIRSAICQYERAWLYAGAGIVEDSDPEREWAEIELKFKPMLSVLTDQR